MKFGDIPEKQSSNGKPPTNGKRALITGITGQDGSYLAEFLIAKGYEVHGIVRRSSTFNTARIDHLFEDVHVGDRRLFLTYGDLADQAGITRAITKIRPDEVYNLGAQSHVKVSFELPVYTADVTGLGAVRILEAIRETDVGTKFYQASSSELYGKATETPQNETTPFYPRSPYGAAKAYAFDITRNYREAYGIHAVNGILFNHESPRRGETFVTRKITRAAAAIKVGVQECLYLGNLDAQRDWGYAKDYVQAMWSMLQADDPQDFVVATGETHSVREFCELAFGQLGLQITWHGRGESEYGTDPEGRKVVAVDPRYFREAEVDLLLGDYSRIAEQLGWKSTVRFDELVRIMVEADMRVFSSGA